MMILRQNAMSVGYEAYRWWKGVGIGEKCLGDNDEVVERGEKEPTACVLMYWRRIEIDLERIGRAVSDLSKG